MMEYVGENGIQDIRDRIFKRRGQVVLNAEGLATISFVPPIILDRDPYLQLMPGIGPSDDPVVVNRVTGTFTQNAEGAYTGVQIKGGRMRSSLPVMNPVSGLLSAVITGVNNIVSALTGLKLIDYGNVNGVPVDWQAS